MVSSQQEEVLGILDLVCHHQTNYFQILLASVHVVSKEQVVRLRRIVADLEDPEQVDVLAVDVSCNDERRVQFNEVWLGYEDLL